MRTIRVLRDLSGVRREAIKNMIHGCNGVKIVEFYVPTSHPHLRFWQTEDHGKTFNEEKFNQEQHRRDQIIMRGKKMVQHLNMNTGEWGTSSTINLTVSTFQLDKKFKSNFYYHDKRGNLFFSPFEKPHLRFAMFNGEKLDLSGENSKIRVPRKAIAKVSETRKRNKIGIFINFQKKVPQFLRGGNLSFCFP
jgi:hypothetical protein